MRYAAIAKFNRGQSLHAMWQALRAHSLADQQPVENDAGVVRDLLNARYYAPAQGQFISQDPVFWEIGLTQDGKNALSNPQALNSYAYANDNPVTNKDPLGRESFQITRPLGGLPLWAHAIEYTIPSGDTKLPPLYTDTMCFDTSRPFTVSGMPVGFPPRLTKVINDPGDYAIATANQSVSGVAVQRIELPGFSADRVA